MLVLHRGRGADENDLLGLAERSTAQMAGAGYAASATLGCSSRVRNTGRDERR